MGLSGFSGNLVLFLGILVVYAKVERELAFDDTYCRFCGVIFPPLSGRNVYGSYSRVYGYVISKAFMNGAPRLVASVLLCARELAPALFVNITSVHFIINEMLCVFL